MSLFQKLKKKSLEWGLFDLKLAISFRTQGVYEDIKCLRNEILKHEHFE